PLPARRRSSLLVADPVHRARVVVRDEERAVLHDEHVHRPSQIRVVRHTPSARPVTARISHTIRRVIEALVMTILLWPPGPLRFVARTSPAVAGAMLARRPGEVKARRATSLRNPSPRSQQDTRLLAGHVLVEDPQLRPIEARSHLGEGAG